MSLKLYVDAQCGGEGRKEKGNALLEGNLESGPKRV